jgi:hypothetical protein
MTRRRPSEPEGSPPTTRREWLRPRELSAREQIAISTLWRWVEKGLVDVRRLGPRWGVRVAMATDPVAAVVRSWPQDEWGQPIAPSQRVPTKRARSRQVPSVGKPLPPR